MAEVVRSEVGRLGPLQEGAMEGPPPRERVETDEKIGSIPY